MSKKNSYAHTHTPPTGLFDPNGCSVIDGILLIVDGSIVPDLVEVLLKVV